jgi:hypothetical protein
MLVRLVVRTALAAMLVGTVPAATALPVVAKEVNAKQIGPVEIQGDSGDFRIVVDGETLLRDADSMFVGIDRVYPDEANPRWQLISFGTGGNACEPEYRMVDLTRSPTPTAGFWSSDACRTIADQSIIPSPSTPAAMTSWPV